VTAPSTPVAPISGLFSAGIVTSGARIMVHKANVNALASNTAKSYVAAANMDRSALSGVLAVLIG
jgi:hypothetical protein